MNALMSFYNYEVYVCVRERECVRTIWVTDDVQQ